MKALIKSIPLYFLLLLIGLPLTSCKQNKNPTVTSSAGKKTTIEYAEGFTISNYPDYNLITVTKAFPDSQKSYRYALVKNGKSAPDSLQADAVIQIPVQSIVVTSTTHIPSLEMLGVEKSLTGFPNLDYISSEKTRERIDAGHIKELGQTEAINTESLIDLDPNMVVSFGVDGENKSLNSVARAGIPVVYNGDWVEQNPLGKAEWIKFFGALYDKQELADSIFNTITTNYKRVKDQVASAKEKPIVISGALFKDVWYAPKGDSWAAKLITDANADYIYKDTEGTGSLSLSIESVLDKAQQVDYWISPNSFTSLQEMKKSNAVYSKFQAFQKGRVFGIGSKKGATGGIIYYELAPNHPDWVLNDLAAIFHPELFPDYSPHFFEKLDQ